MTDKDIEQLTADMLKHVQGQNIGIAVGATLNVLMTLFNYMPPELRDGAIIGVHAIADQMSAMNGVKQ
jgi:hypothetical protein